MPYRDWDDSFQGLFDDVPGMDHASYIEREFLAELFELGFTYDAAELDDLGIPPERVYEAREEFFEEMGIDPGDFDWDGWREAMDYN